MLPIIILKEEEEEEELVTRREFSEIREFFMFACIEPSEVNKKGNTF